MSGIDSTSPRQGKPAPVGEISIGDYLIRRLYHYGVEHCFGAPSTYTRALFEQMRRSQLILPVTTSDQPGAGFAAAAYARLLGLGACCQTYGIDGLKALHTTAAAYLERSAVVLLSVAPANSRRAKATPRQHTIGGHLTQLEMVRKVTVATAILDDADSAFRDIDRALSAALQHKRPVYIEMPLEMVAVTGDPDHVPSEFRMPGSSQLALSDALEAVVARLNRAQQPVIWAGVELQRYRLQETLALLLEITGIPYVTSILGKAVLSELHPQFMGAYQGGFAAPEVKDFVESSDCVVAMGVLSMDINLGPPEAQIDPRHLIQISSAGVNVQGQRIEQVQLHDILGGLVTAGVPWRDAGDFPRPMGAHAGEPAEIYLQTSSGEKIALPEGESVAGRLPGNSIHLDEAGVSRRHASFRRQGNQVLLSDLNSSNGTFVNDILLKPDRPMPLANGDEIGLGRLMTLRIVGPLRKVPQAQLDEAVDYDDTMLEQLSAADDQTSLPPPSGQSAAAPRLFQPLEGEKITFKRALEALNAFLNDHTVVSADNGEGLLVGVEMLIPAAGGFLAPGVFTFAGSALPNALGAQLARPDWRPLVMLGEAAFQMSGAELSTAVRYGLNPIVIVLSSGRDGAQRPLRDNPDVLHWNYAQFPALLGAGLGYTVKTEEELALALSEARQHTESAVIIHLALEQLDYSPSFEGFLGEVAR